MKKNRIIITVFFLSLILIIISVFLFSSKIVKDVNTDIKEGFPCDDKISMMVSESIESRNIEFCQSNEFVFNLRIGDMVNKCYTDEVTFEGFLDMNHTKEKCARTMIIYLNDLSICDSVTGDVKGACIYQYVQDQGLDCSMLEDVSQKYYDICLEAYSS